MQIITSISGVNKVYDTMSKPMRVYGSNFQHYIAKFGKPYDLLNEIIAAEFCSIWGIRVPPHALIRLLPEHVPPGVNRRAFEHPGFGSQYLKHAQELTNFLLTWQNSHFLTKIINKADLLRIGLFDLWLANEDRNHNNANLLIQPDEDGFHLVAIDHVNIFNTNSLHRGIYPLTEESSILYSHYVPLFFRNDEKLLAAVNSLENELPSLVGLCHKQISSILHKAPPGWGIDIAAQEEQMMPLFGDQWVQETIKQFRLYIAKNFV